MLQSTPRRCEYPGEAENTKLFLALEAPHAAKSKVEADFQPVFGTQPPDDNDIDNGHVERSKKNMTRSTKSCEDSDAPQGKKKQDFVKKNIELAGAAGGLVPMTPAEKERLAELLREIDEEDEREKHPPVGGPRDCEGDAWVLSVPTGHGYTPDPAQLEELRYIDSRLNLLCPVEDLWSMQSSFVNSSMSQGPGSDSGWELGRETWATGGGEGGGGGATGRETEERAGDAACPGDATEAEEMTSLGEEQLRSLLDECELTQSSNPQPAISDALLAALLRDPYTSSLAHLGHS
ncbi:hypothetical protein NHX12_019584 [Muraenolepis orangiensis]|uniref:Fibrous sheath-interacting protein 1 n=1 Tax=Muraenolepis orangiensis TaxID=630683 RepID=A0A9Q0ETU4_9TELE|nr:hypothetical protein NHX12_019584 [Muraenolepis orangiensis]